MLGIDRTWCNADNAAAGNLHLSSFRNLQSTSTYHDQGIVAQSLRTLVRALSANLWPALAWNASSLLPWILFPRQRHTWVLQETNEALTSKANCQQNPTLSTTYWPTRGHRQCIAIYLSVGSELCSVGEQCITISLARNKHESFLRCGHSAIGKTPSNPAHLVALAKICWQMLGSRSFQLCPYSFRAIIDFLQLCQYAVEQHAHLSSVSKLTRIIRL